MICYKLSRRLLLSKRYVVFLSLLFITVTYYLSTKSQYGFKWNTSLELTKIDENIKCILKMKELLGDFNSKEFNEYCSYNCKNKKLSTCEAGPLVGRLAVSKENVVTEEVISRNTDLHMGGWWQPVTCKERRKVAIVIPFRDRIEHLVILLNHLHPILHRKKIHYRIFVINQIDKENFNRGKLMNVGFNEALTVFPFDCIVFHDVDLLPEDDRINYSCNKSPQHLCVALDKFNYKLLYEELFGGVEMFTTDHFKLINGFTNSFWGWGAEDDNLYYRLAWKNLTLTRDSPAIARYTMLRHFDQEARANPNRFALRTESKNHFSTDGLINLQYEIKKYEENKLYTMIYVDLQKDKDRLFGAMTFPPEMNRNKTANMTFTISD